MEENYDIWASISGIAKVHTSNMPEEFDGKFTWREEFTDAVLSALPLNYTWCLSLWIAHWFSGLLSQNTSLLS